MTSSAASQAAEAYYDSEDADNFYTAIWGGEDIHVGLYEDGLSIKQASRRTVEHMADRLGDLPPETRVLDLGAGYGGSARYLANRFGVTVTCLNIAAVENAKNLKMTREQGLSEHIRILHGSFEDIPEPDESFDVIWSQDAILHSGRREKVLEEVARVIKPGGQFIFTDPMQADHLSVEGAAELQPVYDRIVLDNLASVAFYREQLTKRGFEEVESEEMPHQLRNHYASVAERLRGERDSLHNISDDYIDRMLTGLKHWVDGADAGLLNWGILHFRKK